jgi:holo-[acyl-carrier protein] synthase
MAGTGRAAEKKRAAGLRRAWVNPVSVLGFGIDLVDCRRIEQMLSDHGERFLDRVFTREEIAYCTARGEGRRVEHFAGRFAAKEAVLKVIGTGWRGPIAWTDVEIVNNEMGVPQVRLAGEAARVAAQAGIARVLVSITHLREFAAAGAVGLPEGQAHNP